MSVKKDTQDNTLRAVDFFCGGGGMSFGMQKAGIEVIAGIDNAISCKETYEANIKGAQFIHEDVFNLEASTLEEKLDLEKNDDSLVLIGCSPCQYWTMMNTDKEKSRKSKNLLIEFRRFVEYFKPGFVVVENVPGVLRKKEESGLQDFIDWLNSDDNSYIIHYKIHNTNDYGVPQNRKRFTLIANRVNEKKVIPCKEKGEKPVVKHFIGKENGFPSIKAGNKDESDFLHSTANVSDLTLKRLKKVKKDGGNRLGFKNYKELQLNCFIGKDNSFQDTFGRLWWNKPASTITTKFFSVSNGRFVHPEENRGLSLREGATLQTFPIDYKFYGSSFASIARIIGNAVPPKYAEKIGLAIKNSLDGEIQNTSTST